MRGQNSPIQELEQLFDGLDRQLDDASRRWDPNDRLGRREAAGGAMDIDLVDGDDEFVVTVDLTATDRTVRIRAKREEETTDEEEHYLRQERRRASTYPVPAAPGGG